MVFFNAKVVNNKITLQYYPRNWIYIFAAGKFELLQANLGGDTDYSYSYANAYYSGQVIYSGYASTRSEAKYKSTFLSPPSMEIGIGFRFKASGKTKN